MFQIQKHCKHTTVCQQDTNLGIMWVTVLGQDTFPHLFFFLIKKSLNITNCLFTTPMFTLKNEKGFDVILEM